MLSVDVAGICASSDDKIVLDSEQRANTVLTTVLHELSTTREPLEGAGKSLIGASDRSGCDISISTTTGAEAIHYSAALEHRVTTPLRVADVADQHELPAVEATYPTAEPTKGYVWTEDQSNQVVSSYSDMVSCVEEQCYISLFKLVQREARNRWHNERAEYYARNEMRWDELNCYRSLVQWPPSPSLCFEEYAGDVAGSGGGHCEIEANNAALFKDEARATELYTDASLLCKRPHRNEPALLMVKDVTEPLEDPVPAEYQANEQNTGSLVIFDEAEHPKQHEKAVVWSINITDGRCSTPPHLRDRPWAPLLMRKSAVQGSIANDSDFTGYNVKRRKKVRSTECAGTATHGAASASGEARFVTLSRSNPCGSLQVCQKARQQGNTAAPIGYAEIYRLHLRKQRAQSLRGAQHLQPCYSKVTVSFLESAEWRYQKMYVDNYLFPSLSPMRGAPRVRKCADGVCSEVERAASIWDLAGY
ncbi:hypothetical protein DPX39_070053900 [Trypanosoma brucei equiperdum]|uniref:Uncharacterized protein n=1 Tax=Trypanosoma brucei equiperdum TaxID=630700 RepID=A0A3L6L639_9TRYP|nr:hypothetical protein DPX39_070053900 [Trypanosoma brucei equiperdum]